MNEALEEPVAMEEEIDFILANAGMYMTRKPTRDDIRSIFVGLRPLAAGSGGGSGGARAGDASGIGASGDGESSAGDGKSSAGDGSQKQSTKEVSRHHKVLVSPSGLVSILGGKWTTYRKMAEDAVNTAATVGDLRETVCPTATLPIHGFDEASDWSDPLHVYGTDAKSIQALDPQGNGSLSDKYMISPNQVRWAVRHEMAMTLEDVLARRSRALFLDAQEALNIAPKVAQIMADELGQDEAWTASQVSAFEQVAASYVPKREPVS
jgi:glycerol-3-phosphate dehydrogenase